MDKAAELLRDIHRIADLTAATWLIGGKNGVGKVFDAYYSQRCLERNQAVVFKSTYHTTDNRRLRFGVNEVSGIPSYSPTRKLYALARSYPPAKGTGAKESPDKKDFVEIWDCVRCRLLTVIDPKPQKVHGKIHADGLFGQLSWSNGEGHVVYLAERKSEKKSFFDSTALDEEEETKGTEFVMQSSWGEQLTEVVDPVICIADVASGIVNVVDVPLPRSQCPQLVAWYPDDSALLIVTLENDPVRFGRLICPIRRTVAYRYTIESGTLERVASSAENKTDIAITSASFSPCGKVLAWLENLSGGPHIRGSSLKVQPVDDPTSKPVEVVSPVGRPATQDGFPGIYLAKLNRHGWSSDSRHIFVTTIWNSDTAIVAIHLSEEDHITRLTPINESWTLLDLIGDVMLAKSSMPNRPDRLHVGKLSADFRHVEWREAEDSAADDEYDELDVKGMMNWKSVWMPQQPYVDLTADYKAKIGESKADDFGGISYQYMLMYPKNGALTHPVIVFPHGGPHAASLTAFRFDVLFLVQCGYAVLFVNYRGSCGYGEHSLMSLPGNVGTQDVNDVQQAIHHAIKTNDALDSDSVVIYGGSHGGFLSLHLVGQFPEFYKAAVAMNPVVDLVAMAGYTDIMDWVIVESLGITSPRSEELALDPLSGEVMEMMRSKSPIAHVDKVQCPVLFALSANDLRCPPKHGMGYIRRLKQRGIEHSVLWYPDNCHPLEKLDAKSDELVNVVKWFDKHLGRM